MSWGSEQRFALPADRPILVADDNEAERVIMRVVLNDSELNNEVLFFADGGDVIDYMKRVRDDAAEQPALILLDVNMSDCSGFDVLEWIRKAPEFTQAPLVVMLTTSDADSDVQKATKLGANALLEKQSGLEPFVALIDARFTNL